MNNSETATLTVPQKTIPEVLNDWDNGLPVISVRMWDDPDNFRGPFKEVEAKQEQLIQEMAFEMLRCMQNNPPDFDSWDEDVHNIAKYYESQWPTIKAVGDKLQAGLSVYEAASNMANVIGSSGYIAAMQKCPQARLMEVTKKILMDNPEEEKAEG